LSIHFKSTTTKDQFKTLIDIEKCYEFCLFFEEVMKGAVSANRNRVIQIGPSISPTKVSPEEGDCEDGKNIARFFDTFIRMINLHIDDFKYSQPTFTLYKLFEKIYSNIDHVFKYPRQYRCSAGDSSFGFNSAGKLIPCHRYFFTDYEEPDSERRHEMDDLLSYMTFDETEDTQIPAIAAHKQYRAYNDFTVFQLSNTLALIREASESGIISEIYKNEHYANILAYFCACGFACPAENYISTVSTQIKSIDDIVFYGNGLIERFIGYYNQKYAK